MLTTRVKMVLAGVVALSLLTAGGWLVSSVLGQADPAPEITENTEILVERWCLECRDYRAVELAPDWQGKNREALTGLLEGDYPGARIVAFSPEQVVVLLPPGYCDACMATLPDQGYIGLAEGNQLAVFSLDGALFKTYGEAPGAWLNELVERIFFTSPEDCLDWIANIIS